MSDGGNGQMREENCNAACKTCITIRNTESALAVQLRAQRHITRKVELEEDTLPSF